MYAIETGENRDHEFEEEWGRVYGRAWRKEREERNVVNPLQSKKN